jgi:hypothetical protein
LSWLSLTEDSKLSIILCLSTAPKNCSEGFPEEVQKIMDNYHLSPFTAKVSTPVLLGEINSNLLILVGIGAMLKTLLWGIIVIAKGYNL